MNVNQPNAPHAAWPAAELHAADAGNNRSSIDRLPSEVVTEVMHKLPALDLPSAAQSSRLLRSGAQAFSIRIGNVCAGIAGANLGNGAQNEVIAALLGTIEDLPANHRDLPLTRLASRLHNAIDTANLEQDLEATTVAAFRDAILLMPAHHQNEPLEHLKNKIENVIDGVMALEQGGDDAALADAYVRVTKQVLAMPPALINNQLMELTQNNFDMLPMDRRHDVFTAAANGIGNVPVEFHPELCNRLTDMIHDLPDANILPATDRLLALVANLSPEERATALVDLNDSMHHVDLAIRREMLDRLQPVIDMQSDPLVDVWCDASAECLNYEEADAGNLQQLGQMMARIDALPDADDRGYVLHTLLESIRSVAPLDMHGENGGIAVLAPVFAAAMERLPTLDAKHRAGCLESMANMHQQLPEPSRAPEWHRLMDQAQMLGDDQSVNLLRKLGGLLGCLPVGEVGGALHQVLAASLQLPAQQRYECALHIAAHLPYLFLNHPEQFEAAVVRMYEHSANLPGEQQAHYLANLHALFNVN